ncbi:AsnC family transcriptional regulator protein (plasmid) [Rhizobium phaseoli]|uniref:AsnC family transcriptional regulator protein n=2 Tax=Rhizobium phaseoli TaxID=396 RepID=A0ABN4QSX0_9HYPH|nr:AsnC family transcriptional regulator protein [Rhizobium phaseoli]ANL55674.1 AsnC family transcriptional regulator protein [Rhizobium phaseoli]ANL61980.1 AsnC family transcriptional regulator protein [Rhizobium phaseoli]ANL87393.1 AsnC family transcriptional regulator protein [Rhizobium phaseoli]ANL93902.1 AsnC family transcriptional regulator protein [Rhizobium phaseoli]
MTRFFRAISISFAYYEQNNLFNAASAAQCLLREGSDWTMEQLDRFDRDILDIVQRDCQLKAETIAERIGLSVSAVQRRLKRLREEGIIKAEVAILDRKATATSMVFIVGMEIERDNYDALAKFRVWAEKQDHIQQVYYVTGAVDLIAIVTARDVEHYDDIAALIMADNPQIRRMHTNVVLRDVKLGLFVPLE